MLRRQCLKTSGRVKISIVCILFEEVLSMRSYLNTPTHLHYQPQLTRPTTSRWWTAHWITRSTCQDPGCFQKCTSAYLLPLNNDRCHSSPGLSFLSFTYHFTPLVGSNAWQIFPWSLHYFEAWYALSRLFLLFCCCQVDWRTAWIYFIPLIGLLFSVRIQVHCTHSYFSKLAHQLWRVHAALCAFGVDVPQRGRVWQKCDFCNCGSIEGADLRIVLMPGHFLAFSLACYLTCCVWSVWFISRWGMLWCCTSSG